MKGKVTFEWLVVVAVALYAVGIWFHVPYGGGHVYSDLISVFQLRECLTTCSSIPIPYVQSFIEYPIGTAFFMYAMGAMAAASPGPVLANYYLFTSFFLLIPTILLIRDLRTIALMRGVPDTKILWYFIITPTFIFMLLVNWYIIGTYFSFAGIRYFLQGRKKVGGLLLGLSAVTGLVTAAPALGLFLSESRPKSALGFLGVAGATYALPNLAIYLINPTNWLAFWQYQYSWYIEGSWMLALLNNVSPLRHVIPLALFSFLTLGILVVRFKFKRDDPLTLAFLSTFAFVFSTYVYTPQMNVLLLPFFVLLPVSSFYLEFLTFDILNSAIIVVGFSQVLQPIGITYQVAAFGPYSIVQWFGIVRSFWVGKFLIYNGLYKNWKEKEKQSGTVVLSERPPAP